MNPIGTVFKTEVARLAKALSAIFNASRLIYLSEKTWANSGTLYCAFNNKLPQ